MEDTTMKKTYNNPTMEVVKIQTQQMLAGSPNGAHNEVGSGSILSHSNDFDFED